MGEHRFSTRTSRLETESRVVRAAELLVTCEECMKETTMVAAHLPIHQNFTSRVDVIDTAESLGFSKMVK